MDEKENKSTTTTPVVIEQNQSQATEAGKELKTNADANNLEFGEEIRKMLATAGTLDSTPEQKEILSKKFEPNEIYIKPDGTVYLTWTKYAERLTKAFTGIGWAMIPQGMPKMHNNLIVWGFHLVIKGVYCGFAIGEQSYFNNGRMTYGEACEGAKSNALTRLCKGIGIGTELWDKEFVNNWLDKYADKRWDANANEGKGKYFWSLKPNAFGTPNQNTSSNLDTKAPPPPAPVRETATATVTPLVSPGIGLATPVATEIKKEVKAEVKAEVKTTPPAPAKTDKTPSKNREYTGKGKSKLAENKDFLKDKNVPVEEIKESEVTQSTKQPVAAVKPTFDWYDKELDKIETIGALQMLYNERIKNSLSAGEITEDEKETLRKKSNALFVKLSSQGK